MKELANTKQAIILLCKGSRKRQGITLKELGAKTGFHYSSLSMFESGAFQFDKARGYYQNILNADEKETFAKLIDDLKEGFLYQ